MIVLGIDPGGTTGLAEIDTSGHGREVILMQLDRSSVCAWLYERICQQDGIDLIAIERFTISARTHSLTRQNDALEIIGATKAFAEVAHVPVPLVEQLPANAKTAWSDERLATLGFYEMTKGREHARDALRHALLAVQRIDVALLESLVVG